MFACCDGGCGSGCAHCCQMVGASVSDVVPRFHVSVN